MTIANHTSADNYACSLEASESIVLRWDYYNWETVGGSIIVAAADADDTYTLTSAESRMTVTNTGDDDALTINLPAAAVGLEYIIWDAVNTAGVHVTVDGNGAEEIGGLGITAVADNDASQFIHIKCIVAGAWVVVAYSGTWD